MLANNKSQHSVTQKGQRAIVTHARMLVGKRAMRKRLLKQAQIPERVTKPCA